ncbi:MAG: glycosyltransferase family 2 protein [Acidobacteriia bacterium]|nr:glycosyltransferase family 2 protein [Terriglobia bacterium]
MSVGGVRALLTTFLQSFRAGPGTSSLAATYQRWLKRHALTPGDVERIRGEIERFRGRPLISVITPVYNTDSRWLTQCVESVRAQLYPHWELSLFDDGSTEPGVREILRKYEALDSRIKVGHSPTNLGISLASNAALARATGEYVTMLDHDDELAPEALFEVARFLQERPEADIIYSDEDKLELDGSRSEPFFKPDWSPEYLLSCMYTSHLGVYRRELVAAVGGFRPGFEGCQDYDLMLRLAERTKSIFHIPKVLYHWRKVPGSTAGDADAKSYKTEAARRALEEHTRRRGLLADVLNTDRPHTFRVKFKLVAKPLVSILIPCRDGMELLRDCLKSIQEKTIYSCYEIIIIDNDSSTPEMRSFLANLKHRVISFPGPFNFSRINNLAARDAGGDHLIFLNSDTRVISPEWISALLEFTQQKEIGIAGAKLYYPDGRIQHAGVILGLHGVAGHSHKNFGGSSRGYFDALFSVRNCSAVTAACMMVRREVFDLVGGFDEGLAVCYNDVDLCLRVREAGYRVVWTPYAELYHHEMIFRGHTINPKEVDYIKALWGEALLRDPYYNDNLTLHGEDFGLRF